MQHMFSTTEKYSSELMQCNGPGRGGVGH